ncbi:hypothetical protein ACSSS7_006953 [Eimeria intestinalis]
MRGGGRRPQRGSSCRRSRGVMGLFITGGAFPGPSSLHISRGAVCSNYPGLASKERGVRGGPRTRGWGPRPEASIEETEGLEGPGDPST